MAQRRMFSKRITETDLFLDMPMSAQCLYFHLNMAADDDGFVGNTKTVQRMIGASADDLRILEIKEFIIPFGNGIVVIRDWKIHNYIRSDRYTETVYLAEKSMVTTKENGQYELGEQKGIPNVIPNDNQMDTQVRLGEVRVGKDKIKYADRVSMTVEEYEKLISEYGEKLITDKITDLDLWKGSKGKSTKSDYLTIRTWIRKDEKDGKLKPTTKKKMEVVGSKIPPERI